MRRTLLATAVAAVTLVTGVADAHQGNPNMESIVRTVTPNTAGVSIDVLNRDDRFMLTNHSGETVVIYGYNDDQYARLLPNGTVQVNKRSPAYYLNDDRFAEISVPASADPRAPPQWTTLDKTSRFQWHDHRMHYMGKGVPPAVKDKSRRQRIFSYAIPVRIGGQPGAISGTLFWTPQPAGGPPAAAIVALIVIVVGALASVRLVRRRRGDRTDATDEQGDW